MGTATGACFPGHGLCCPDDPLDLVLQLFPTDRAPSSLAALGIGVAAAGEPPASRLIKQDTESPPTRRVIKKEPEPPQPLEESAFDIGGGGGGVGGLQDSWGGLSSFLLEGLCTGLEETDVGIFFADDDALDNGGGGGDVTEGNLLSDPTHMAAPAAAGGGPVDVLTRGSSGGAVVVVPNDASPFPSPMPAGAFPLQASYDACRAFDAAVFSNASPPAPVMAAPVPAGCPPPFFVTNNGTPPLPAIIMPAAAADPAPMLPAVGGAPPVFVTNNSTPRLPALIMPAAAHAPMPPAATLHACDSALPGIVSNMAPAPPLPLMASMPAPALHPNAAALAGAYSYTHAPANAPPSATPSSSPPSMTSFGSGRSTSSATSSETEFLEQPRHHVWVVPRKLRSPPSGNRRKRPWLLDFPLHALPPVALPPPPANPTVDDVRVDDKGNDYAIKNSNAMALVALAPPGNGDDIAAADSGGGIRRRRAAPRQRNRQAQRVCSHCHSPETPQWRAGPDGPGTLCNACGIRYAANRLLPEYRPSTAPSFQSGQHSNRHRKVMKLREQMMKAASTEDKPSSEQQQPMLEDDRRRTKEEDDDGSFLGVCEYISAAGL